MSARLYRTLQALLLFGLFLFLIMKIINNQLVWYINLRFVTLTIIGIVFLVILVQRLFSEALVSGRQAREEEHHEHDGHDHPPSLLNLGIMLIPLLIGVLIPARPLDSSAVAAKGLTTSSPLISSDASNQAFEMPSEQRNVLDWIQLFHFEEELSPYLGQPASVVGFVYFDERLPDGQFFVSRFILSCCAADGYAVGMIAEWAQADSLEQDQWIQVKGPVDVVSFENRDIPVIRAETIEIVPQPDQPYLYP